MKITTMVLPMTCFFIFSGLMFMSISSDLFILKLRRSMKKHGLVETQAKIEFCQIVHIPASSDGPGPDDFNPYIRVSYTVAGKRYTYPIDNSGMTAFLNKKNHNDSFFLNGGGFWEAYEKIKLLAPGNPIHFFSGEIKNLPNGKVECDRWDLQKMTGPISEDLAHTKRVQNMTIKYVPSVPSHTEFTAVTKPRGYLFALFCLFFVVMFAGFFYENAHWSKSKLALVLGSVLILAGFLNRPFFKGMVMTFKLVDSLSSHISSSGSILITEKGFEPYQK